jgi:hypothetical protein
MERSASAAEVASAGKNNTHLANGKINRYRSHGLPGWKMQAPESLFACTFKADDAARLGC